jgi:hypothetical protein
MVVFGGALAPGGSTVNDVWFLSLGTTPGWSQPSLSGSGPTPRYAGSAIYDGTRRRMVAFGGTSDPFSAAAGVKEVWSLGF